MKFEIILAITWANLCLCERHQRSTVLTDESKRILEHFDFSNFDKQEALNYLDRQRYDNQIRGKRSHSKFKREQNIQEKDKGLDAGIKLNTLRKPNEELKSSLKSQIFQKDDLKQAINLLPFSELPESDYECQRILETTALTTRSKRGHHRSQKKHRSKSRSDDDSEKEEKKRSQRKKKKKKKRHYWNNWTEWSPCSVTCGRGRKIRWRKCIAKKCTTGELEMGEKTCQLPACNLFTKLLGL